MNTVAGGGSEDGLPAIEGHQSPDGHMIFGQDGTMYFISNYQIWSISPGGTLHLLAGTGLTNFNGDGPALACNLSPGGLARDTAGNFYFSDHGLIRKLSGGVVTSIAGNGLPASYTTDGAALSIPVGPASLAVDAAGNIYVAEVFAARVRKISPDGQISLFAGAQQQFLAGPANALIPDDGDGGPATLAHLASVADIAVDSGGNVYIAEEDSVRRVTPSGIISTVATASDIFEMALDPAGNVYYQTGTYGNLAPGIYKISSTGSVSQVMSTSSMNISSFGFDAASNLYYSTGPLYEVTGGSTQEIAGRETYSSPDGVAAAGAVISPVAITVDSAGRLVFEDTHCLLRRINTDGTLVTIAGTGTCANATPASGPALSTAIMSPSHLAAGGGIVFIASANGSFEWLDTNGNIQVPAQTETNGIAADSTGTAWIGGDNQLVKFTPGNAPVTIQPPPTFTEAGIAKAITTDASGNVYVVFYNDGAVPEEGWILSNSNWAGRFNTPADLVNNLCMNGAATYMAGDRGLYQFTASSEALVGSLYGMSGDGGPAEAAYFGNVNDLACDASGNVYVNDRPNARIRKLSGNLPSAAPVISANGIVNSASYSGTEIAPMELVSIFGQNLAPALQVASVVNNYVGPVVGNVKVTFDGNPAPLLAVSPTQINAVVPVNESTCGTGTASVEVFVDGISSAAYKAPCAPAVPGLFSADMSGKGPGAILNQDGSINSATNPAARGTVVSFYGTGAGVLDTVLSDGYLDLSAPYGNVTLPVAVTIGGEDATVQYAGGAPYLIDGAVQINATVPADITPGAVTVTVSVGGVASNAVQVWTK